MSTAGAIGIAVGVGVTGAAGDGAAGAVAVGAAVPASPSATLHAVPPALAKTVPPVELTAIVADAAPLSVDDVPVPTTIASSSHTVWAGSCSKMLNATAV